MHRFFRTLLGSKKKAHATARPRTAAPRVETFEARDCPAVTVTPVGSTIQITGDNLANVVTVTQNDALGYIRVDWRNTPAAPLQTRVFGAATITGVSANLSAGDDSFTYGLASDLTRAKTVSVLLGAGHDRGMFDFGLYKSHAVAADLALTVRGEGGNDTVRADYGDVGATRLTFLGDMSDGYDTCSVYQWGMLRGTAAKYNMAGGNQNDTLHFYNDNGSWASSGIVVGMNGQNGDDHVSLRFDDIMNGHYRFTLGGDAGNDTVLADIYHRAPAPGAPLGDLSVRVAGHDGTDRLRLHLQDDSGRLPILSAVMDGGLGFDTALPVTTPNVTKISMEA
jgi:hypothetical protein